MKQIFEMTDQREINTLLDTTEYGTLALCSENKPYSLPLNFARIGNEIYFHGSKSGRKIEILKQNSQASFSIVEPHAMIQSYFSSHDGLACPATQFFKSIMIEGKVAFVEGYDEKVKALESLMKKLQPEGKYKPLGEDAYQKAIHATTIYKLIPSQIRAKYKFGQHLTQERFEMIVAHLKKRDSDIDQKTVIMMKTLRRDDATKK